MANKRPKGKQPASARARRPLALGVDVGGVIVALAEDGEDTSFFGSRPLETPAVEGVWQALASLTEQPFAGRVHIVSKAGPKVAGNTRDWLAHHRFFEQTGIAEENLHFVRERRDKAPICKRLGLTHFVDDRLDVLAHMETVEHRYLFGPKRPVELPAWATAVKTWAELTALIQESRTG